MTTMTTMIIERDMPKRRFTGIRLSKEEPGEPISARMAELTDDQNMDAITMSLSVWEALSDQLKRDYAPTRGWWRLLTLPTSVQKLDEETRTQAAWLLLMGREQIDRIYVNDRQWLIQSNPECEKPQHHHHVWDTNGRVVCG